MKKINLILLKSIFSFFVFFYPIFSSLPLNGDAQKEKLFKDKVPIPVSFKVAFIGDSGKERGFENVLNMIKAQNAQMVIHMGDLAYDELNAQGPAQWNEKINSILGEAFPYFFSVGNHDVAYWDKPNGYLDIFKKRLALLPADTCFGYASDKDFGSKSYCVYQGIFFTLSGVGTLGDAHESYLEETLVKNTQYPWKICSWHKNQRDMQVGTKMDEAGWGAYQICQKYGAMIATGHEHSYARTKTLTELGHPENQHGTIGLPDRVALGAGKSFVFVSGLAGNSIRPFDAPTHRGHLWWASIFTSNFILQNGVILKDEKIDTLPTDENSGVLFVEFNYQGDMKLAKAQFITNKNIVRDDFMIELSE